MKTINTHGRLPESGFVRVVDLVRNPKRPGHVAIVPVSRATLWRMVKAGKFPKPVQLAGSAWLTAWPVEAVRAWLQQSAGDSEPGTQ